jgi:hypothetical protein
MTAHKRHCHHKSNDYGFDSGDLVKIVQIGAVTGLGIAVIGTLNK